MNNKIFLYGYYGRNNVGDDAMLYSLLQEITSLNPKSKFSVLSPIPVVVPQDIEKNICYVRPSIYTVAKRIFYSKAFVLGGGTHLFDYGKKSNALKIQLRIFLLIFYAKIIGKNVYILHNGLGPLRTCWSSVLPRLICHMSNYISVRDHKSYSYLINWGFVDKSVLSFDLAVLIEPLSGSKKTYIGIPKKILGISVTPVFDIYHGSKEKDLLLIDEISKHVNYWLEEEQNSEVHLFVFHGGSKDNDILISKLLQNKLVPRDRVKLIPYDPDPRKLLSHIGCCSTFIGMKYHSCVFAYIMEKPLLVIDYHPKCRAFAEDIGLSNHAIISLDDILNLKFGEYFKHLRYYPDDFVATLPIECAKKRAKNGLPSDDKFGEFYD